MSKMTGGLNIPGGLSLVSRKEAHRCFKKRSSAGKSG